MTQEDLQAIVEGTPTQEEIQEKIQGDIDNIYSQEDEEDNG